MEGSGGIRMATALRWLTSIANREHFPLMSVGLVPVDHASAVFGVDLHVHRTADRTAVLDARSADALKDYVEFLLAHAAAKVLEAKRILRFNEVESESFLDLDRRERP